jgi:eukaryotic-like serine/threonine-protein kinase
VAPDDAAVHARLHMMRATRASLVGDTGTQRIEYRRAREQAERIGDIHACSMRINEASAASSLGLYGEAEALLRGVSHAVFQLEMGLLKSSLLNNLADTLEGLGRLEEAESAAKQAIALAAEQGDLRTAGGTRIYLARILLLSSRIDEAEAVARASCNELTDVPTVVAHAEAILARVLLARGAIAEAAVVAARAESRLASGANVEEGEATIRLVYAEALAASGQAGQAREALRAARDRLLERAAKIKDPAAASSFLRAVRDNARTLELARAWGV